MRVEVLQERFDPWQELSRHEQSMKAAGRFGAASVFVGSMRDFNEGADVKSMFLEHYPAMTARYLEQLGRQTTADWPLLDVLLLHRVGAIAPGDPIVLVATWSAHRQAALEATRHLIEELKARAPFWKKEQRPEGDRWVESNTPAA